MATQFQAPVSVNKVGSFFVQQYYQLLQQQPDYVHQFYTEASTIMRIDGESCDTASAVLQIHTLIRSLNFTQIEIKTINSLQSWSGSVLVVVSGIVKSTEFTGWRKFNQTFVLAPQEKGYFVLNDILHFLGDDVTHQHPASIVSENRADYQHPTPIMSENRVDHQHPGQISQDNVVDYQHQEPVYFENEVDSQLNNSTPLSESPDVAEYEVEATEHYDSIHVEGDVPVDEYSLHNQQQQEEPVVEFAKETPVEESSAFLNVVDREQEPPPVLEESTGESRKFSYASILRAPKGKTAPPVIVMYPKKTMAPVSDPTAQPTTQSSFVPDTSVEPVEEGFPQEGESKSVYVKNLPTTISTTEILDEFRTFGTVKPDGVFIKRKENGVCFAFVEFEDVESAQTAIQASPLQLLGRKVYIEERKQSSSNISSRGGRGRGRGSYQNDGGRGRFGGRSSSGRGNYQDGRGNGVRGAY